jgi:mannan endo-1,4-beta-mannosidase
MTRKSFLCAAIITAVSVSVLTAAPSNPNAIIQAKQLLQYLVNLSGQKILSGQESMFSAGAFPSSDDKTVYQKTGKYPAIYTSDFGDVNTGNLSDRNKVVSNAISYHAKGSIIAFQYHMIQPNLADGAGFNAMNIKGSTYTYVPQILTAGSAMNVEFNKRLDELAGYFKTLETAGIAVLFRPFHEMNGDFFWWSFQDRFKELWIYEWNYLTNTKKCNNLLWVFGVNWYGSAAPTSKQSPSFYYPGHAYVDILGCDFYLNYGHSYDKRIHDELRTLGGGKPIAIPENGQMPDIATIRATQPYWVYFCTWHGFESSSSDALYTKNYGDPSVITQDEVLIPTTAVFPFANKFGEGTPPSVVSFKNSPDVLYTLQGRAIKYSGKGIAPAGLYFSVRPQEGKSLLKISSKNNF